MIRRSPLIVLALLAAGCMSLVVYSRASAVVESNAYLNANLQNGIATAQTMDNDCKVALTSNPTSTFNTDLRGVINGTWVNPTGGPTQSASYRDDTWISSASQGNTVTPIVVPYGTTDVALRLNSVKFLCRPMVVTDLSNNCTIKTITGATLAANGPWVTAADGKDTAPNPVGNSCQDPALTLKKTQYISMTVAGGGTTNFTGPVVTTAAREADSRYWFSPNVTFNYSDPAGINSNRTVTFTVRFKQINGYNSTTESAQTQTCRDPSTGVNEPHAPPATPIAWSACGELATSFTVQINVASYDLAPTITIPSTTTSPGSPMSITSSVAKTGSLTTGMKNSSGAAGTTWNVYRLVYGAGTTPPTTMMTTSSQDACGTFSGEISCTPVYTSNRADGTLGVSQTYTQNVTDTPPSPPFSAGQSVCYVTSVSRPSTLSDAPNAWRHSILRCAIAAKRPTMAAVGGDVSAGGSFSAPCAGDGKIIGSPIGTFGSFGEYGLFATGDITNFASAAILSPNTNLTFANTPTTGHYESSHCIDDYVALYAAQAATVSESTFSNGQLNGGTADGFQKFTTHDPPSISGNIINANTKIILYAPGRTVRINGDISYTNGGIGSFKEAPSLTVIADRIEVEAGVHEIAGIFYASSLFHSCIEATDTPNNNKPAIVSGGTCKEPLRVNGSVIAGKLLLPRTRGGDLTDTNPAETFVYRPEVFLTQYEDGLSQMTNMVTDVTQELPPRY